jgi:hypothetical protein
MPDPQGVGVGIMIAHNAESARGIAPRAAHRSGLEPLDSSGSCHPMKTAVLHLDRNGSSCCQLTKPAKTQVACPLRFPGITPVPHYYEISVVHLRSSLYSTHDVISSRLLTMTFTTAAFDRSSSWRFEASSYKATSEGLPPSSVQHGACAPS